MISIIPLGNNHLEWNQFVIKHPYGNLYHLVEWKRIIEKTYGLNTHYLIAYRTSEPQDSSGSVRGEIAGILPLAHIKHFLFGNNLVSVPFFDFGGVLADGDEAERALLSEAVELSQKLKANHVELRHLHPLRVLDSCSHIGDGVLNSSTFTSKSHKVRMLLRLPENSDLLMKSFKSKLRSQIRKPSKEGLVSRIGGLELLDEFYDVFSVNMRDLGSPVHSKRLMLNVLNAFPDRARICMVYQGDLPLACSLLVDFKDTMENPWASSRRYYARLSPNMLLYWTMLEYACDKRFGYFDFGRSSPDEGTYSFKEQWGAEPMPLHWHYISTNGTHFDHGVEKSKFNLAISAWRKLPVRVTQTIGPQIRKYIEL